MKLVSFIENEKDLVGIVNKGQVYPCGKLGLPANMKNLLEQEDGFELAKKLDAEIKDGKHAEHSIALDGLTLISPVPKPTSTRDAYAFRQHVFTARRNRGVDMIPEFDQFPIFYFTNHNATYGGGNIELMADHFRKLDFELEVAIVVGKKGRNISAAQADDYIAGYMIMNDLSARELQMDEMKLNLGPAKGKDFGNTFGPYLLTPDELEAFVSPTKAGHTGKQYNLTMKAFHNGNQVSEGNVSQMDWTFAEILERVSYGVDINPGDVIGSGTVGTGCYLELNGSRKLEDPNYEPVWIQPGDNITLEIDQLGTLSNTFSKVDSDYSLQALKKNV